MHIQKKKQLTLSKQKVDLGTLDVDNVFHDGEKCAPNNTCFEFYDNGNFWLNRSTYPGETTPRFCNYAWSPGWVGDISPEILVTKPP